MTGIFAAAYTLIRVTSAAVPFVIDHYPSLRRRILKNRHIEGYWVDIIINPATKAVREFSFITITYEDGKLNIEGIIHDEEVRRIGHFKGRFSSYSEHRFEYAYSRHSAFDPTGHGSGLGSYDFAPERPYPMSATGRYYEPALDQDLSLNSIRINDRDDLMKLELAVRTNPQSLTSIRPEMIRKYARRFQDMFREFQVLPSPTPEP